MSTLYVSSLQNVGAPQANISLNADGSVTLPVYTSAGTPPALFQPGTLWYDSSGSGLVMRNATNTAWIPAISGVGVYLPLAGGTMTGAITFAAGQTFPASGLPNATPTVIGAVLGVTNATSTGLGCNALLVNTGANNVAVGLSALQANTTGIQNTATGVNSLGVNVGGVGNTATGYNSLCLNSSGRYNTAQGACSLQGNTSGCYNTAVGVSALYSSISGNCNTGVGVNAIRNNTTGFSNTAVGLSALSGNTTGNNNVAVGSGTLGANGGGAGNVAVGSLALQANAGANLNTAVGFCSLFANGSGTQNTAIGANSLVNNDTGCYNTASGACSLRSNTTGNENIALGFVALAANTTGNSNTGIGFRALCSNGIGVSNTAIGFNSLINNTNGNFNIGLGFNGGLGITTGSGNISIGGLNSGGSYLPAFNITTQNNRISMGSTSVTNADIQVAWTPVSDARDKIVGGPIPIGLEFVKQLEPVSFHFKETRDSEDPHGPKRYGFLAQDVLALEGEDPVLVNNEDQDRLRLTDVYLIPVLVNAVKQLAADFEEYKRTHP